MTRRLGKGLGSLLGEVASNTAEGVRGLPVSDVEPNPHQPRTEFDAVSLAELRESIARHGILQPVCVRPARPGKFELVAGERRWRCAVELGLERIPAVIREDVTDRDMLELALVENLQRADLDPIEKAVAFRDMLQRLDLTQEQVAERVGLQRASVANHVRLLELPDEVQEALRKGLVAMGHARALLGLPGREERLALLAKTVREGLSVRQVERAVQARRGSPSEEGSRTLVPQAPWVREIEGRMREHLGTRATIQNGAGYRGRITIDYHDRAELDRLCALLAPAPQL